MQKRHGETTQTMTISDVKRQNILNNSYAVDEVQKATKIRGIEFEGRIVLLREQVAKFFEVDIRTISNYIDKYGDELRQNGYEILRGKRLQELKLAANDYFGKEIDFLTKTKEKNLK